MDKLANPIDTAVLLSKLPPGAVVSHTHLPGEGSEAHSKRLDE